MGMGLMQTADWHDCSWLGREVEGTAAVPPALPHCPLLLPPAAPLVLSPAVHTLEELKLSGNHLKGSRPVLSFDK